MMPRRNSKAAPRLSTKKKLDFSATRDRTKSGKVGLRKRGATMGVKSTKR